ncbi:phospholipase A2 [Streptomyces rubradiris]|uniref:phospholipase A2 n=1 Tax=Streptomyces rubradiris TaxID=285531 RepID=UPI0036E409BC
MRKTALPVMAALSMALLLPQQTAGAAVGEQPQAAAATVEPPLAEGEIQQVGPGLYSTAEKSFELYETDVAEGLMGRTHTVTEGADGVARPESAPATRPDQGVFGPGWEAGFLGGQLNRKLEQKADSVVVTDLDAKASVSYALKSSVDYPSGGGVKKYETASGDKLTETTTYNEATGTLVTTAVETLAPATGTPDTDVTGDEDADAAVGVADLTATYNWKQVAPGTDKWRVTSVGNLAAGATATVSYDTKGRVATVSEPATADAPAQSLTVKYSTATTATGTALGEYTGRAKEITLTSGATTQTLARYSYDASGLLRNVTNPVEGTDPVSSYAYDSTGRVSDIASPSNGEWDLAFPADSAAPNAAPVGTDLPSATEPLAGPAGDGTATTPPAGDFTTGEITDPQAYPRYCNRATEWMWYLNRGCVAWSAHYGWHWPYFRYTPTGFRVAGILYDGCSTPGPNVSRPGGFNFRAACDTHDYGYGLIGNTYKGYKYYLDRSKKSNVDNAFYTTMKTHSCKAYNILVRWKCNSYAYVYLKAVAWKGNPKNGANKT